MGLVSKTKAWTVVKGARSGPLQYERSRRFVYVFCSRRVLYSRPSMKTRGVRILATSSSFIPLTPLQSS